MAWSEHNRRHLPDARLVAVPGCYPTSVILGAAPLLRAKLVRPERIYAACLSGVSGAGREAKQSSLFCEAGEGVSAYGIGTHRHQPEMEQGAFARRGRAGDRDVRAPSRSHQSRHPCDGRARSGPRYHPGSDRWRVSRRLPRTAICALAGARPVPVDDPRAGLEPRADLRDHRCPREPRGRHVGDRQPGERRGRSGRAMSERDARGWPETTGLRSRRAVSLEVETPWVPAKKSRSTTPAGCAS